MLGKHKKDWHLNINIGFNNGVITHGFQEKPDTDFKSIDKLSKKEVAHEAEAKKHKVKRIDENEFMKMIEQS